MHPHILYSLVIGRRAQGLQIQVDDFTGPELAQLLPKLGPEFLPGEAAQLITAFPGPA